MAGSTRNPWEENYSTEGDSASGAKPWEQSYQEPEKPKPRNLAAVANDTAIEVANAAAGGVSAAANFVKPGNAVSGWIDKNIVKAGEDAQSDVTKAAKQQFRQDVESADGVMGELGAVGRYVVENLQETPSVGDGLALMVEAYQRLDLDDLAATSLETLKLNYPDHPTLVDGQFVPVEEEADNRSWLAKATLGLIESDAPLPPGETRASQDVVRQYEEAAQQIPRELQQDAKTGETAKKRSIWSYLTFGLFD